MRTIINFVAIMALFSQISSTVMAHLVFEPKGEANGKHIVLIAGDEEYRTEESCPMLGKILSQRHGFKCTVLFAVDPELGYINPNEQKNIPHTSALNDADLMIIGTRFRNLPDEQMSPIYNYLKAGKPVIGFRTSTHAFRGTKFGGYDWNNFGASVIGDNWVSHHGDHKRQGGRGVIVEANAKHPVLRSVKDVFTPSDIYGIKRVNDENATILMRGAVTESLDPKSKIIDGPKNDPMQPFVWLREYQAPESDKVGKVLGTTAGASVDFLSEDLRRLIVNGAYHLTGLNVPEKADVTPVDTYEPSFYGFYTPPKYPPTFFKERDLRVPDFRLGSSAKSILEPAAAK